jgi:hypothetical protein
VSADGPGRREVAHRLFAAEFEDADLSYSESDEERAPNYVVTPTGARINRLFVVGVLTEIERVNEDVLRGRVVDPSGAFVTYAGQYQPDPMTFLERAQPPAFVALSGKARTFQPDDSDRVFTSVRPESINEVDAETRDRWIVGAARATLYRVAVLAEALTMDERGDELRAALEAMGVRESVAAGVPVALDHYGTSPAYLDAVRRLAVDALETVADERDAVRPLDVAPDEPGGGDVGPIPASVAPSLDRPTASTVESEGAEPVAAGTDADASTASVVDDGEDVAAEPAEAVDTPDSEGVEAAEEASEPEPTTAAESVAAADSERSETVAPSSDDSASTEAAGDTGDDSGLGDFDDSLGGGETDAADAESASDVREEPGDFDDVETGMYELDEEERQEVEEEFGTEFSTGAEVDDPGEADIDVPDASNLDAEASSESPETPDDEVESEPAPEQSDTADAPEPDADVDSEESVDLEDAVVDAMAELDDGDGASREAVVAAVVDDTGADPESVEDAVQDALMGGRCYEPSDGTLKAI